ncbi:MAG: HEAT repeat domain-containing protein, partial [Candidatus Omnitrophica bacterium]|nr:HEAT repeat domain-containing protein [Candidatus Omnitrophota bacterium]
AHLIELIGYLKNEELVDLLVSFINHKDSVIRVATVMALSGIGGEKSIAILSRVVNEELDEKIRDLASSRLQKLKGQTPPKEK